MEETTTPETQVATTNPKSNKVIWIAVAILAVAAMLAGGYYYYQQNGSDIVATYTTVATVNGKDITKAELDRSVSDLQNAALQSGADITDPAVMAEIETQALESLINKTLLLQAADEAGFTATDEEVETEYQKVVDNVGGEEALANTLEQLNVSEEALRDDLKDQLIIDKYLRSETAYDQVEITNEEIQSYYDQATAGNENAPALEDVAGLIQSQLAAEKQQQIVTDFINQLKEGATIEKSGE